MKNLILVFCMSIFFNACAVASLTTAVVKTTAAVVMLPVKVVGAAVEAVTPDSDEDEKNPEKD